MEESDFGGGHAAMDAMEVKKDSEPRIPLLWRRVMGSGPVAAIPSLKRELVSCGNPRQRRAERR